MYKTWMLALLVAAAGFASYASAQGTLMPMPPHDQPWSGSSFVRGYWFTAPTDFTIIGLRVPTEASTAAQSIHVMRLPAPPPIFSTTTSTFQTLFHVGLSQGTSVIPVNIPVSQGDVIGVLGYRGDVNSYAPRGPQQSSIGGQPITLTRLLFQGSIQTAPAANVSEETAGAISRVLPDRPDFAGQGGHRHSPACRE
jgi:hypothetical protein